MLMKTGKMPSLNRLSVTSRARSRSRSWKFIQNANEYWICGFNFFSLLTDSDKWVCRVQNATTSSILHGASPCVVNTRVDCWMFMKNERQHEQQQTVKDFFESLLKICENECLNSHSICMLCIYGRAESVNNETRNSSTVFPRLQRNGWAPAILWNKVSTFPSRRPQRCPPIIGNVICCITF